MPSLSERQSAFAGALLNRRRRAPEGIVSPFRAPPEKRFNVYRNTIYANLTGVLQARFPAVARLVGDEFFRATACEFIDRHPPVSPVLMRYGGDFAGFLETFEPASGLPFLGDVARLEWAWSQAYHAADAPVLDQSVLQQVSPDMVETLGLALHPSLTVLRSRWPVVTIWSANIQESEPAPIDSGAGGEDALVLRPGLEVMVHRLPESGAVFIEALGAGRTLGEAAGAALAATAQFDLQSTLTALLLSGGVTALHRAGAEGA